LKFTYVEINSQLCRMIPQKTWDSKAAKRLSFNKRIDLAKPSQVLAEQNLRETLEDVSNRLQLDENDEPLAYAYTIEGVRINTLSELDPDCRVMIVSSKPYYEGLRGLDKFFRRGLEGRKRPTVKLDELKPKPAAWVHTATVSWLN